MINILKTFVLLGILSVIFIFIGGLVGGESGIYTALIFSLLINGGMYFYSDKLALATSGAKPLGIKEHPQLHAMVKELATKMDMPMPKLYITPMQQANAFATGRDPHHASVAVTEGILKVLSKEELKRVLVTAREEEVLQIVLNKKAVKTTDVQKALEVTRQQAHSLLSSLVKKEILQKFGKTKTSYYKILGEKKG